MLQLIAELGLPGKGGRGGREGERGLKISFRWITGHNVAHTALEGLRNVKGTKIQQLTEPLCGRKVAHTAS